MSKQGLLVIVNQQEQKRKKKHFRSYQFYSPPFISGIFTREMTSSIIIFAEFWNFTEF